MATDVSWADRKRKLASLIGPLPPLPTGKILGPDGSFSSSYPLLEHVSESLGERVK